MELKRVNKSNLNTSSSSQVRHTILIGPIFRNSRPVNELLWRHPPLQEWKEKTYKCPCCLYEFPSVAGEICLYNSRWDCYGDLSTRRFLTNASSNGLFDYSGSTTGDGFNVLPQKRDVYYPWSQHEGLFLDSGPSTAAPLIPKDITASPHRRQFLLLCRTNEIFIKRDPSTQSFFQCQWLQYWGFFNPKIWRWFPHRWQFVYVSHTQNFFKKSFLAGAFYHQGPSWRCDPAPEEWISSWVIPSTRSSQVSSRRLCLL